MSDQRPLRVHAIYAVLDEACLFQASIASIYDFVDRITVITTHDRDWQGDARSPSAITAMVLSRDIDPDRKIDLIVTSETNEARARNRAMDYAAPRRGSLRVQRQHERDDALEPPDYFLIIDADEIYESDALVRLAEYVTRERRPLYRVPCIRYFKRWNYRIDGHEHLMAFVRADQRLPYLRLRKAALPRRALARIPGLPASVKSRLLGFFDVPPEVGTFHHGSYVGPRGRITAKLGSFGHRSEVADHWLEDVYDTWTVDARDFNPVYPSVFPSAERIDVGALPAEISGQRWTADYLEC